MDDDIKSIVDMLENIINDRTIPRNVRNEIDKAINSLKDEKFEKIVRVNTATMMLDEISTDTNIPMYARTQIWNILSLLEQIAKKK